MRLKNGLVYRPDGVFTKGDVAMEGGVFSIPAGFDAPDGEAFDVEGLYLIPGLTDLHFHGCAGHDFSEGSEAAIRALADYEESVGVTAICPATMTLPEEDLLRVAGAARSFPNETGAELVGIHMEGPFISEQKKGAQNPAHIRVPDVGFFERVQGASGGLVKILSLAPELEGALDFIEAERGRTTLSLAHTVCDYDTAKEAFERGARHVTHLYNAMPPIGHRNPGPIVAAVDRDDVDVELICDGVHLHPAVVRATLKLFGPERVLFVSDSMEATGMPDGRYELGGLPVVKTGRRAALSDGTIAGSVTNLMDCVRTAVREMGVPLETAVRCAAVNPARALGIEKRHGSIEPGKAANLVVLNRDLELIMVFSRGRLIRGEGALGEREVL
ncbi:MAG: N-acetylglucosamine-6-phosphate deacetylase [Synergistaceae bacterium]|nr:N-acetylglucosamine-6-phosphate deacetylase [Synergistaceae bacterium]